MSAIESVITERGIKYEIKTEPDGLNIRVMYQLFGKGDCGDLIISVPNVSVKGEMDTSTTYVDKVLMEHIGSSSQEKDFSFDVAGVVNYMKKWLRERSKT